MNGQTARAAVLAVVVSVCASATIVATADKYSLRARCPQQMRQMLGS
ncbi:hypothetical protein PF005_g26631 [Phytophthora fragariae]|uniref:Uncharacterized protein n=1 Tax=Phytophthora fragariae TaxID=53985 RepID=A0A6A3QZJ1_9STRA|nr:hypothetical protein PF003_g24561 [Phytophthora fragariae]KAE8922274.1 hypothetical protein PF009_g27461 [Phytophthora fragariae]KAE8982486.1 hypothetical protein PF011_g21593 [Phytophthora fragariae]KAE9086439.1 hypothetical protein PF006_g26028 [Phytophthora fragariae]KAE9096331.1 hypothetical protein PF007_g17040 [Phytophthora fragariae]